MPRYIDADAFIQFVETNESIIKVGSRNGKSFHTGRAVERYYIFDLLRNAPTISPDEVRGVGEWICDPISAVSPVEEWYCNICKQPAPMGYGKAYVRTNYCPNCGAKMEVSGDA